MSFSVVSVSDGDAELNGEVKYSRCTLELLEPFHTEAHALLYGTSYLLAANTLIGLLSKKGVKKCVSTLPVPQFYTPTRARCGDVVW
jgi:hypothetical protein